MNIAAPVALASERTSGEVRPVAGGCRSARRWRRRTARRGDAHTSTPVQPQPGGLARGRARGSRSGPPARPRPCRGCRARTARSRARSRGPRRAPISAASVPWTRASSGRDTLRQQPHGRARRIGGLEAVPQLAAGRLRVAGHEQPAPDRQQVRHEADGKAERLPDLGRVLVRPDAIRRDVLEHEAGVRGRLRARARRRRRRTSRRRRRSPARATSASGASASSAAVA